MLFPIGMFPAIMIVAATVFFDPAWPRRWLRRLAGAGAPARRRRPVPPARPGRRRLALAGAGRLRAGAAGAAVPAPPVRRQRALARAGDAVLLAGDGAREERQRHLPSCGTRPAAGAGTSAPRDYLRDYQERDIATQPDLIWQLAQQIGQDFAPAAPGPVEVRADVQVSLNGRRAAPLIDPTVDLLKQQRRPRSPSPGSSPPRSDRPPHLLAIQ